MKRDHNRIGQDRIRLFEIVLDLSDMGGDLRPLKSAEAALSVASDPVNRGELTKLGRAGYEGQHRVGGALLGLDRLKNEGIRGCLHDRIFFR